MKLPSSCPGRLHRARTLLPFVVLALALPFLSAQTLERSPDDDWRRLQALLSRNSAAPPTPGERTATRQQRAARLLQAVEQARDFHLRHPAAPQATLARKIEVTALLESAQLGSDPAAVTAALARAGAFRADPGLAREHRFEVALAAERLKQRPAGGARAPGADERLADTLRREFGPIPEVHGLYAGLAARAEMDTANRLATKLLEMRPPPGVRAAAESITARYGLVGRPLALRLTRLDATTFELPARPAATGPTVLYVWTPGHAPNAGAFAALSRHRGRLPANVRWIYLGLGVTAAECRTAATRAPFAGIHCQDDAGARSAVAQRLKVTTSPTVFVLNRQGVLTGFGPAEELPALLARAAR